MLILYDATSFLMSMKAWRAVAFMMEFLVNGTFSKL